jgi:DNA gyrase/topoisomerase IV subunit A
MQLTDRIGQLVNDKTIEGIAHVNNESNKEGTRIVLELKARCRGPGDHQPTYTNTPNCKPVSVSIT